MGLFCLWAGGKLLFVTLETWRWQIHCSLARGRGWERSTWQKSVRGKTKGVKRPFRGAILICCFKAGSRGNAEATTSAQDFPAFAWLSRSSRLTGVILLNFDNKATGDGLTLITACSLPSSGILESAHTLHPQSFTSLKPGVLCMQSAPKGQRAALRGNGWAAGQQLVSW